MQIFLRQQVVRGQRHFHRKVWTIDESAKTNPAFRQSWHVLQKEIARLFNHNIKPELQNSGKIAETDAINRDRSL